MTNKFDTVITRQNSGSTKWDDAATLFGSTDVLPFWVADMDFPSPPAITEALAARVRHGIFGYPSPHSYAYDAVVSWMEKRHNWQTKPAWMVSTPGVVTAITLAVQTFTKAGDKIIIQPPVYPPFFASVQNQNRTVIENPLFYKDGSYHMDFDDLAVKAREAKMLILCSPHNPVGRVWSRPELAKLLEICLENNVLVLTDEIHGDLVYTGHQHIPLASLETGTEDKIITLTAPSKTFNTAGLYTSIAIIADSELRRQFSQTIQKLGINKSNVFGITALEAAYRHGAPWLDELLIYLEGNAEYLTEFISDNIPALKVNKPQGTYLAWLDCRNLNLSQQELVQFFAKKAKVGLNDGITFGRQGTGFMRLNFGCPRPLLAEGLQRIALAVKQLR
ncbi:MalY/PatB family protein [Sporomusa acidovorans]|uniref:cysteine-S-conjugate beta-lyase n=1 Tax=Sporomusa acidovorans (strain ATCC 49682 / DSM 3132 / Mol) TaxID=1123286 RepID=A0ABZ3IZB4_SPOA4|nr:PatB family C-S lyase [Sporomusa acidovorans]OZC17224.1 cystathionine beta-lyase PatB [Sporomusa acidovorans DSM 3132]SDF15135.1 cystathione beta-lyase [Sporomusa acidovorans]